jgi:hypothetical protein
MTTQSNSTEVETGEQSLPAVGGRVCEWSMNEFEHRCLVHLMREQEKIAPDNGLIAVLCNAVRLARETTDHMTARLNAALGETK